MKHKKCMYFLLTFVLLLSFGIIQKKEGLKAEESGVSSGHIYKVSPTGYVCGTTPPSANILEAQFVPDDANHNIEVRVRKCAGGNLISDGNAYVRVDNFKDYTYEVSTTDYVCGTTPPTQGIVALRLTPDDTNHDLYVRVRKCDSGDFSKDGKVYITVDGQQKWGPYDYNAGDSSIRFDINPVGHSEGIVGKHTYQAEVYPTGQAEPILSGEIDAWETYASYTWGPFFRNAGVSEFTFDIDPVDDKSIVGTHTYQVHWYPNGQDNPIRTGNIGAWDEAVTSVDLRPINESIETLSPFFAGSTVGLQASVKNEGSASAGQSVLGYYISDSSSGSALEPGTIRTNTVPSLSAGGSSALLYEDLYIPINAQVGTTYYAVFEADIDTDVAESDESNNKASKTLTVQACDTSAMYCDVPPGHTFQAEVEALRDNISNGCNSRANVPYQNAVFCPEMLLDRASMAVFAVRRRLGYNATLGTYQGYFTDVSEDTPFALWIEKAYELDIVGGCEGSTPGVDLKYCPNYDTSGWAGIVTRGQVAIFLARTEGWDLNNSTTGVFDDVTGDNEWERAVEYMWWQGYIHGVPPEIGCQNSSPTGDLIYCGSDYVNRGTAAGFMSRVFGYVTTQPRCNVLTVSTNPSDAGSVSKNPVPDCPIDSSKYKFDTSITLTANPNTGYTFNSWSGYASGSDNPVTIVLDRQDRAVTANFQEGSLVVNLLPSNESVQTTEPFFAGSSIGVQSSVKNAGGASAAASKIGYWVSGSSNGVPSNDIYTHTNSVPSLSAGSTSDLLYEDVGIPVGLAPGDYYVVFDADTEEAVAESNESDNKASVPFTISPCDTSNMYCDVASDRTFREEIEALRDKISNGCRSATNDNIYGSAVFCPDAYVGRDAMAVFMVRRKLGTYNPTLGSYQGYFVDVSEETTPFALWIEKAYELDIVEGCEEGEPYKDLKYCPNYDMSGWAGIVTRAQVAIFLARTEGWDLSDPTTGVFDDVTGDSEWERAVEYMWRQGYIHGVPPEVGCQNSSPSGDHIYCGSDYVNRGTAAGFMSRAFGYVTTIKGYVRDSDNNGIDGVTINFSGGYGSVETSHGGFYHHTGFPDGTYTLTPSKSGYSFTPSSATVSATGGNVTQDFVGNPDTSICSASEIDAYLASKNSPLNGWGNVLVAKGQQYNVDPRLVIAIAGTESTFAQNGECALSRYNAWGYGGGWPKCKDFGSWESAIDRVTWQLWQYRNVRGLNNIHQIGQTWCGSGCQHWEPNTRAFYAEQGGNPDSSDLSFSGACGATTCPQSGGGILYQKIGFDCNGEPLGYGYIEQPEPGWQNIPSSFDNKASSIKLPAGWSAKLFQGTNRGNSWICLNESDSNFTDDVFNNGESLDNAVSSFELFSHSNCDQTAINDIVSAARAQIGVPYSAKRHPYCGTWGPWRAKYSVCTDLVIDAYLLGTGGTGCGGSCNDGWWGAMRCHIGGTNIEALLRQDGLDNPDRYRWRSARNAEDMRQYFYHNQIYLDRNTDWQAGDIVFFDWYNDGVADHVGIISEVSGDGPTRIVQSTGSGSRFEECKSGACEVDWDEHFQEGTAAHGRIAASYQLRSHSTETQTTEALRLILQTNDPLLMLTLHNPEGKWVNQRMDMSLVANNNENFIPYIPYNNISWINNTQSITIYNPLTGTYQALITSTASSSFTLEIAIVKDGEVQQVSQHFGNVMPSDSWGKIVEVSRSDQQNLQFDVIPDSVTENLVLPSMLTLSVKTSSMGQNSFVISTTNTYSVSVELSTLHSQIGEEYPYENVQITPAEFTSYAGISHIVYLTATAPSQAITGQYLGMLKITLSFDDRDLSYNIPLQINYIDTEKFIYLPVVLRAYKTY